MRQSNELEMLNYELVYKFKQTPDGSIVRIVEWWNIKGPEPALEKTDVTVIKGRPYVRCKSEKQKRFKKVLVEAYLACYFDSFRPYREEEEEETVKPIEASPKKECFWPKQHNPLLREMTYRSNKQRFTVRSNTRKE